MSDLSQRVLDDAYGQINFKQSKGIDSTKTRNEVIREVKSEAPQNVPTRTASQRADGIALRGKTRA